MNNNLRGVPVEGFADKSREAAVEGIVLLKNENNTLPLTEQDKVSVFGKSGYITGFTSNAAYIKDENNDYITLPNKTYKQVSINKMKLECHNNNWQYIIKNAV